jgi:hypothetical protein
MTLPAQSRSASFHGQLEKMAKIAFRTATHHHLPPNPDRIALKIRPYAG